MYTRISRVSLGIIVATAHVLIWIGLTGFIQDASRTEYSRSEVNTTAYIFEQPGHADTVPIPEVRVKSPALDINPLLSVQFEDLEQGDISAVVAAVSAPRLTEACAHGCDPAQFMEGVGLTPGQVVTVVLTIEVLENGSTGSTQITRSSGNDAADSRAILYARTLHWIPATMGHRPVVMRVRFPITFACCSA